jgi:DNA-binding NtrC family response regulator
MPPPGFDRWLEAYYLGRHPLICSVRKSIAVAARETWPVLISGETGTGKDMAALAIHAGSRRNVKEPQVVAVGGLGETAWSVLFGHRKGAFTGAERDHEGVFRMADGSTVILEDVSEIPAKIQPMLLRAVEHGTFRPLGEEREVRADVRIVSTTNTSLAAEAERGRFRPDLYQRLSLLQIQVPPLRDHLEDLEIYVPHFMARAAGPGRDVKTISPEGMEVLYSYRWPRNVRELQHVLCRASVEAPGEIVTAKDLKTILGNSRLRPRPPKAGRPAVQVDRDLVIQTLRDARGNKREAARRLGVAPGTFYRLVVRHRIGKNDLF